MFYDLVSLSNNLSTHSQPQ